LSFYRKIRPFIKPILDVNHHQSNSFHEKIEFHHSVEIFLYQEHEFDSEKQELLESVELGEWKTTDRLEGEMAFAKKAAENFIRKDERITLRFSSSDLDRLKQKAAYKGLPYQTFIASVLHEYSAGHFIEVDLAGRE
jgi:predicted DNA binding CopG/RHH family protein